MTYNTKPAIQALQGWYNSKLGLYDWTDPNVPASVKSVVSTVSDIVTRYEDSECWWESANATGTLVDYMATTGDPGNLPTIVNTFAVAQGTFTVDPNTVKNDAEHGAILGTISGFETALVSLGGTVAPVIVVAVTAIGAAIGAFFGGGAAAAVTLKYYTNFINTLPTGCYDDEGWWAETWIKAYDLTRDINYLTMAQTIFEDMANGWDSTFGGGIWWEKNQEGPDGKKPYKNAVANALYFAVAARLYIRMGGSPCLNAATQECNWFLNISKLIVPLPLGNLVSEYPAVGNLVQDSVPGTVNATAFWTYNQGVILGALCDWYAITGDEQYLNLAIKIADGALAYFSTKSGILLEKSCDPNYNPTTTTFKGPFMRNLAKLTMVTQRVDYATFIKNNAAAVWSGANEASQFGAQWGSPPDATDFIRQTAAIDALNANNRIVAPISVRATVTKFIGLPASLRSFVSGVAGGVQKWGTLAAPSMRACIVAAST